MQKFVGAEERQLWAGVVARVINTAWNGVLVDVDIRSGTVQHAELAAGLAGEVADAVIVEFRKRDGSRP